MARLVDMFWLLPKARVAQRKHPKFEISTGLELAAERPVQIRGLRKHQFYHLSPVSYMIAHVIFTDRSPPQAALDAFLFLTGLKKPAMCADGRPQAGVRLF